MGYVIKFCSWIMGNQYLFALLIFAIIVEILLLPFGIKQQKNSIKQARLRPKEMAIRKKYAGRKDQPTQQKMTAEIQELYQKEGFNPMGGCLPLLIQLPIIMALYWIVLNPMKYICGFSTDSINQISSVVQAYGYSGASASDRTIELVSQMRQVVAEHGVEVFSSVEGFSDKIQSLSDIPNLNMFGRFDLGGIPWSAFGNGLEGFKAGWWMVLIPVLTFVAYFFSMKMNRKLLYQPAADDKAMGCSNNTMDIVMPLFSVYIAFIMPAAIGIYWIFKSLLGVAKQAILHKAMPTPVFTEEDYKAAEKELNVRPEKNAPKNKSGRVVRSLHHIDDEDFEDTREAAIKHREALEAQEAAETEKTGKGGALSAAPIKEDAPKKDRKKKADAKEADTASEEAEASAENEQTENNDQE